jgi:hypothetical protein
MSADADDLPIKVYEGTSDDVAFLNSPLDSAGIQVTGGGHFFGATCEVYVRQGDEAGAREVLADFESRRRDGGKLLPGRWPK